MVSTMGIGIAIWGADHLAENRGGNTDLYDIIKELCWPDGGDQMGIGRHKKPGSVAGLVLVLLLFLGLLKPHLS
ncbi:hypothetical protein [Serratia ficaria]|uniref:hypothetical protein n=1 Tax=Serratia ficaria TaxID=61651 RepID=UPI0021BAC100|nr:hypothetical protein [Serratia ficaria]